MDDFLNRIFGGLGRGEGGCVTSSPLQLQSQRVHGEVPVLLLDGTWIWGAAASATALARRD